MDVQQAQHKTCRDIYAFAIDGRHFGEERGTSRSIGCLEIKGFSSRQGNDLPFFDRYDFAIDGRILHGVLFWHTKSNRLNALTGTRWCSIVFGEEMLKGTSCGT
jgi:hypothetical protein